MSGEQKKRDSKSGLWKWLATRPAGDAPCAARCARRQRNQRIRPRPDRKRRA